MNRVDNASLKTSKPWLPLDDCASLSRCCLRVVFEGASLSLDNIEDFAGVTEGNQFQSLPEKNKDRGHHSRPVENKNFKKKDLQLHRDYQFLFLSTSTFQFSCFPMDSSMKSFDIKIQIGKYKIEVWLKVYLDCWHRMFSFKKTLK